MALSGSRLQAAILTAIQTAFPINTNLKTAEKTAIAAAQLALAASFAPPTVTEITGNASVPSGITVATTGTAAAQTGATNSAGTVT